ncbi:Uncharacterised protein [Mycobacteroides abscessus subsp. bolletii]|uniref:hypothetical protein n=1 Tax=Mycobacteroides abscessus TaxID=36809 RepID=UPI0009C9F281|nr:hypothetical protein [Mycobacteroides abscessus]SKG69682.1 Uncharacterised protein [Mycobacteroides abscessus subsp. bolletii]SLF40577.1 Uncharacterised protein [Mycobacteroides abscessus subsp. bolletii]
MNERKRRREAIDLSQAAAAARASVSLATWRRWEEAPESVSAGTRAKCERVLDAEQAIYERHSQALRDQNEKIERLWTGHALLTPRQAAAIQTQLDVWQDLFLSSWLDDGWTKEPLYSVPPFDSLDPRVLVYVNDNRAWAYLACQRCIAVRDEMDTGVLPFDRDGCFFDEVLMALVIDWMTETYEEDVAQGLLDDITPHHRDSDWEAVSEAFDSAARWREWEIPTMVGHQLLPSVLVQHHPFTWFDVVSTPLSVSIDKPQSAG